MAGMSVLQSGVFRLEVDRERGIIVRLGLAKSATGGSARRALEGYLAAQEAKTHRVETSPEDTGDYVELLFDHVFRDTHRPCFLMLRDELENRTYHELDDPSTIVDFAEECGPNGRPVAVRFVRRFAGAPFALAVRIALEHDCWRWEIAARQRQGPDRSIRIFYRLPLPTLWYGGWKVWSACDEPPRAADGEVPFSFHYGPVSSWRPDMTSIPMVTLYHEAADLGLSFVEPFEVRKPAVRFHSVSESGDFFLNTHAYPERQRPYLEILNSYLGLRQGKETVCQLLVAAHQGDWRCGLNWVYQRYRDYFDPRDEGAFEVFGPSQDHNLTDTEEQVRLNAEHGCTRMTFHGYFPEYGRYLPEEEEWLTIHAAEKCGPPAKVSRKLLHEHLAMVRRYNLHTFMYWQCCDGSPRLLESRPELTGSIVSNEKGEKVRSGHQDQYMMNPDPSLPWGQYSLDQARKLLEEYSELEGLFWDTHRHMEFDFARDDGVTMVNNRPVFLVTFAFENAERELGRLLDKHGKYLYVNKPTTIESCREADAVLAESGLGMRLAYLAISRNLLDSSWWERSIDPGKYEAYLQFCLKGGISPFVAVQSFQDYRKEDRSPEQTEKLKKLCRAYLPLLKLIQKRKWVLTKRPFTFPAGYDGNLFQTGEGQYALTVLGGTASLFHQDRPTTRVEINTVDKDRIRSARMQTVTHHQWQNVPLARQEGRLFADLPPFNIAAVVELQT